MKQQKKGEAKHYDVDRLI